MVVVVFVVLDFVSHIGAPVFVVEAVVVAVLVIVVVNVDVGRGQQGILPYRLQTGRHATTVGVPPPVQKTQIMKSFNEKRQGRSARRGGGVKIHK